MAFTEESHRLGGEPDGAEELLLEDFDGDGDLDLYIANTVDPDRLLLNDGAGWFAPGASFAATPPSSRAAAAADLDGDGDLDLVALGGHACRAWARAPCCA